MSLPGVRVQLKQEQRARMTRRVIEPQQHERASIFLLLAQVLSRLSKLPDAPEAKKVGVPRALVCAGGGRCGGAAVQVLLACRLQEQPVEVHCCCGGALLPHLCNVHT